MNRYICFIFIINLIPNPFILNLAVLESDECKRLAPAYNAELEHRLWDGTRIDMYTNEEAIEVDFARKWAECYGQATYYGIVSGKRPAMLLLVADMEKEKQFVYRAQTLAAAHDPPMRLYIEMIPRD